MKVIETGAIQPAYARGSKEIAIRDQSGDGSAAADMRDDFVEVRMQHRLAAADRDDGGAEIGEVIHSPQHLRNGYGGETASNSLQYVQARLQRRMGTICARIGWCLECIARANIRASRSRRPTARKRRREIRNKCPNSGIPLLSVRRGSRRKPMRQFPTSGQVGVSSLIGQALSSRSVWPPYRHQHFDHVGVAEFLGVNKTEACRVVRIGKDGSRKTEPDFGETRKLEQPTSANSWSDVVRAAVEGLSVRKSWKAP